VAVGALLLALWGSLLWAAPAGATPAVSTCGKTTVGKVSDQLIADQKRVNACAVPFNAEVTELTIYLAPTSNSGSQVIKGVIYADEKGRPGALEAETGKLTFMSKEAPGWYHLVFATPLKLAAGNYWIGVITGATGKVAGERYDSVANAEDYNANNYTSGASNPFGPVKTTNEEMSLYASFTRASGIFIPKGHTATLTKAEFHAFEALTYGYQLNGGANVEVGSQELGGLNGKVPDATVGPVSAISLIRIFLTSVNCGFTYYSDGLHAVVSGSNPFLVELNDAFFCTSSPSEPRTGHHDLDLKLTVN
jgi:hypothetical protein